MHFLHEKMIAINYLDVNLETNLCSMVDGLRQTYDRSCLSEMSLETDCMVRPGALKRKKKAFQCLYNKPH